VEGMTCGTLLAFLGIMPLPSRVHVIKSALHGAGFSDDRESPRL
jgi:hypothetical protein